MIHQPESKRQIRGSGLRCLERRQHVRSQLVDSVPRVLNIAGYAAGPKVARLVVLLAAIKMQRQLVGRVDLDLTPARRHVHRSYVAAGRNGETLAKRTQPGGIGTAEESPAEFHQLHRPDQPVQAEDVGGCGAAGYVGVAQTEARSNFKAPRLRTVKEFQSALPGWPEAFQTGRKYQRIIRRIDFGGFKNPGLRADTGILPQQKPLLNPRLGVPVPQIARPRQRRKPHLGKRSGLARRVDWFVLSHRDRGVLPRQIQRSQANAEDVVGGVGVAREEIEVDIAAGLATSRQLGPLKLQSQDRLPESRPAGGRARRKPGSDGVLQRTTEAAIAVSVEQHHAGNRNRHTLRGFHPRLRQVRGFALQHCQPFCDRRLRGFRLRCHGGGGQ